MGNADGTEPMKVVFDISVLGLGELEVRARTGVFRVVENLALGLASAPECELELRAGGEGFHAIYGALRYLEREDRLARVPFRSAARHAGRRSRAMDACLKGMQVSPTRRLAGIGCEFLARGSFPLLWGPSDDVDIYHSPHSPLPPVTSGSRVKRFLTVYDLIAVIRPELFEPHVEPYVRRILESIGPEDRVTCISEATRRDLCEVTGIDPARVFVTPLAASRQTFHPVFDGDEITAVRARYGIPDGTYLLCLNTLEPRKNMVTAIRAFARMVEDGATDLSLVLVGERGWMYESVLEAAESSRATRDRIVFAGFVADEHLAALYSGASAFVYPSLYEGFGLPVLEAMQCGVPVVTSNTSSIPEVVGDAGQLIDPHDVDGFADALMAIRANDELRQELGRRSIARAAEFSWERCTRETIAAYRTAIDA